MRVEAAGQQVTCGPFHRESLFLVGAEAECSLQQAGIPPLPSGSHKYLPVCDWKYTYISITCCQWGFVCNTGLFLAAGASPPELQ